MKAPSIRIFDVDAIEARVEVHDWPFARDNAERITTNWRKLVAEKPAMFDGRVMLMSRADIINDGERRVVRSAHFETAYSAFMAWRDFGFPEAGACNCFAMAALRGADGGFILGEMGAHTSSAGQIYFPAGTPDRDDVVGDRLDLDGSVLRELDEETGLSPREVTLDPGWTIVDTGPKFACMKTVRVDAPATDIARDLNARIAAQADPELARMHVIAGPADIDHARMPDFTVAYLNHMLEKARP